MGTDGACGLLFCAAKRSGTFPPNFYTDELRDIRFSFHSSQNLSVCTRIKQEAIQGRGWAHRAQYE
jgi:hypothetical protein